MFFNIRSNYLVHWTGKDIETDLDKLDDRKRHKYIERIEGTIAEGLWMTKTTDEFDVMSDGSAIKMEMNSVTCFTELRPTVSFQHIKRYGLLGFGFSKNFLLERHGSPVLYINTSSESSIMSVLKRLLMYTNGNDERTNDMRFLLSLCKPMVTDGINNMEEMEWRIINTNQIKNFVKKTNCENPKSKLPFNIKEIELLILPDPETKQKLFQSNMFRAWIKDNEHYATIITLNELSTI